MKKRDLIVCLLVSLLLLGTVAVGGEGVTITDDLDRKVSINEAPERIISLAPSNTEILFALGLEEKIVGVTEYADYPEAALEVERIGTITEPNLERIIAKDPDLIIASSITPKQIVERLESMGLTIIGFKPQSIADTLETINQIGRATYQTETANKLLLELEERIENIERKIAENVTERPKVFYEVWKDPLTTAGANTFINDLIEVAGGKNIAAGAEKEWPQYSKEILIEQDPDIYLSSEHSWREVVTKESIMAREDFKELKAVKNGRVAVFDPNVLNRAGPRLIDALEQVAKVLHPDLFE